MSTFWMHCYVEDWPAVVREASRAERHLRSIGRPKAADLLLYSYGQFRDELVRLGPTMAKFGTEELRKMERLTRVRPDTAGGGGPRLGDSLFVRQIDPVLLPGGIGIADEDILNARVPWWRTNEEGSSGRVGGRLYGYFYQPGAPTAPNSAEFRQHALFRVGPEQDEVFGMGIIRRPIPARHFIDRASDVINAEWKKEFLAMKARFSSRLVQVRSMRA